MAKSKERSEIEFLRSENRNMKKQINHLKKEISRKTKRENLYEDLEQRTAEEMIEEELEEKKLLKKETCPNCQKKLDIVELGKLRKIYTCDCGYRTVKKA